MDAAGLLAVMMTAIFLNVDAVVFPSINAFWQASGNIFLCPSNFYSAA